MEPVIAMPIIQKSGELFISGVHRRYLFRPTMDGNEVEVRMFRDEGRLQRPELAPDIDKDGIHCVEARVLRLTVV